MAGALTKEQKAATEQYVMPKVSIGMTVLWHMDGDTNSKPRPLVVTDIGPRTINGVPVGSLEVRVGIRHCNDLQAKEFELAESGVWQHTEETAEIWGAILNGDVPKEKKK